MKNIKFIFAALLAAAFIALGSTSVYAQEDNNRDANGYVVKGPYLTNGFWSNWFIGLGGGVNVTAGEGVAPFAQFNLKNNWAAEGFVGKWLTPTIGLRAGYKGVMNNFGYNTELYTSDTFASGEQFRFGYVHGDVMWNLSNALGGYKETRFWDIVPYVGAGYLGVNNGSTDNGLGVSAGVFNEFRLGNTVNLFLDVSVIASNNFAGLSTVADQTPVPAPDVFILKQPTYMPTATVGLTINLSKKKNFGRYSSVAPDIYPLTVENANLKEAKAVLEAVNDRLVKENDELRNRPAEKVYVKGETKVLTAPTYITFDMGKDVLSDTEKQKVKEFSKYVPEDCKIIVVGSADSKTGSEMRNYELAQNRADAVKKCLEEECSVKAIIIPTFKLDATENAETSRSVVLTIDVD